jgi:hypothetical protein
MTRCSLIRMSVGFILGLLLMILVVHIAVLAFMDSLCRVHEGGIRFNISASGRQSIRSKRYISANSLASGPSFLTARVFWKAVLMAASSSGCTQISTRLTSPSASAFWAALTTAPSIPSQWASAIAGASHAAASRAIP